MMAQKDITRKIQVIFLSSASSPAVTLSASAIQSAMLSSASVCALLLTRPAALSFTAFGGIQIRFLKRCNDCNKIHTIYLCSTLITYKMYTLNPLNGGRRCWKSPNILRGAASAQNACNFWHAKFHVRVFSQSGLGVQAFKFKLRSGPPLPSSFTFLPLFNLNPT